MFSMVAFLSINLNVGQHMINTKQAQKAIGVNDYKVGYNDKIE